MAMRARLLLGYPRSAAGTSSAVSLSGLSTGLRTRGPVAFESTTGASSASASVAARGRRRFGALAAALGRRPAAVAATLAASSIAAAVGLCAAPCSAEAAADAAAVAGVGMRVRVDYEGTLEDGTVFDSSMAEGRQPIEFTLGAGASPPTTLTLAPPRARTC